MYSTCFDVQFFADQFIVVFQPGDLRVIGQYHLDSRERQSYFQLRFGASGTTQRRDLAQQLHRIGQFAIDPIADRRRVITQMDAFERRAAEWFGQPLPKSFGQKRHEGGDQLGDFQQRFVQRPVGVVLVLRIGVVRPRTDRDFDGRTNCSVRPPTK